MTYFELTENDIGDYWNYKGCIIQNQSHPKLLKYACYTKEWGKLLGTCSTIKGAKEIINDHLNG